MAEAVVGRDGDEHIEDSKFNQIQGTDQVVRLPKSQADQVPEDTRGLDYDTEYKNGEKLLANVDGPMSFPPFVGYYGIVRALDGKASRQITIGIFDHYVIGNEIKEVTQHGTIENDSCPREAHLTLCSEYLLTSLFAVRRHLSFV